MIGLMRVKNEARWIERSVRSILPVCEHVLVMDDHSSDETAEICAALNYVTVLPSPFTGLEECRDKNWLLDHGRNADWVLMIDGDELLDPESLPAVREAAKSSVDCYSLRVLYLWDREDQVRTDGVYGRFRRASMFRPGSYRFEPTSAAGGFHCGNAPWALQLVARPLEASLLHLGYLHRTDRVRKFDWYNTVDPNNLAEDQYQHVIQGDVREVPAESRLLHAGPLKLEALHC